MDNYIEYFQNKIDSCYDVYVYDGGYLTHGYIENKLALIGNQIRTMLNLVIKRIILV